MRRPWRVAERPTLINQTMLTDLPGLRELILVRHGEEDRDEESPDPQLSAVGREQARLLATYLASERITRIVASPLVRAAQTAGAIEAVTGVKAVSDGAVREIDVSDAGCGDMTEPHQAFVATRRWDVVPYVEDREIFRGRVAEAINRHVSDTAGEGAVIVVCHGGVINAYLATVLGSGDDWLVHPANAAVTRVLCVDERRALNSVNETHFLPPSLVTY